MKSRRGRPKAAPLRRAPPRAAKDHPRSPSPRPSHSHGRLTRSTAGRSPVKTYYESDDDISEGEGVPTVSRPAKCQRLSQDSQPSTTSKRRRYSRSYHKGDDTPDELAGHDGAYISPSSEGELRAQKRSRGKKVLRKRLQPLASEEENLATADTEETAQDIIPQWQTLPYHIITSILTFASAPVSDDASVKWLVATARTCRAFAEPAITALYQAPPLSTQGRLYGLSVLLAQSPESTTFKYRQKVESITLEVGKTAIRSTEIANLVRYCPRLSELDIRHFKDMSPYRQLDDNLRFTYSDELFRNLTTDGITPATRLKSWRWSRRMMGKDLSLASLKTLHQTPTFAGLQKLTMVNFQRPLLNAKDPDDPEVVAQDQGHAEVFAAMLNVLPDLTHLVLESSTVVNEHLLPLLPPTLQHLELINCWDITADPFTEYLVTNGNKLRELTLHHNQSLSLSFLPVLSTACPNLVALRMNLTYYNHHEFYRDSDPFYEHLLTADEVPTWPRSLQVIELEHLRQWDAKAAEVFFNSLVDSAPELPVLRHLAIKAMLDIPWRDRSKVRDRWVRQLKRVFERPRIDPAPLRSIRPQAMQPVAESTPVKKPRGRRLSMTPSRRSGRIATLVSGTSSRASSVARDLRRPGGGGFSYREPDSDEDLEFEGNATREQGDGDVVGAPSPASTCSSDDGFVQGLCEVVDIRFDNQKPMETQFGMDDFLDSDHGNSDDEWTGDEDEGADGNDYAW